MKLMIVIVQDEDIKEVMNKLRQSSIRATKLSSSGSFLRQGNTTILIGIEEEKIQLVKDIIKETCKEREVVSSIPPMVEEASMILETLKVKVGGAIIFILDLEEYLKV